MTLRAYFTLKSVFELQGCRALTSALVRLSCFVRHSRVTSCTTQLLSCL